MDPRVNRRQRRLAERQAARSSGYQPQVSSEPIPIPQFPTTDQRQSHASEWHSRRTVPLPTGETYELILPKGDHVTARRLPLDALMEMRQIPNRLLPTILEWMEPFKAAVESGDNFQLEDVAADINKIIRKDPRPYIEIASIVWMACVLDPVTVPDERYVGQAGTIPLSWVHLEDLEYVFDWAQGVNESALDFFRRRQAEGLSVVGDGTEGRVPAGDLLGYMRPVEGPVGGVPMERGSGRVGSSSIEPPQGDEDGAVHS